MNKRMTPSSIPVLGGRKNVAVSRRSVLRGSAIGATGIVGLALVGCGDDDEPGNEGTSPSPTTEGGSSSPSATNTTVGRAQQGRIKFPVPGNFPTLDPVTSNQALNFSLLYSVFDSFVGAEPDGVPTNSKGLASEWEVVDPLQITFKVRPTTFHDGTAVTADAVREHFLRAMSDDDSRVKPDLAAIESLEAVDDQTLIFNMNRPFAPLLRILSGRAGLVTSPAAVAKFGSDVARNPVGAGAFLFDEELLDERLTVNANPNYWMENSPTIAGVDFNLGVTGSQAINGLQSGLFNVLFDPDPARVEELKNSFKVKSVPTQAIYTVVISPTKMPDVHRRRAINYAIDRDVLNETVFFGLHQPAHQGWLGPAAGPDAQPDFEGYRFDSEKVRSELALAGVPDGFEFTLNVQSDPQAISVAEFVQASLKPFGIDVILNAKPTPDYILEYINGMAESAIALAAARTDIWQLISVNNAAESSIKPTLPPGGFPQVDSGLEKAAAAFDPEERKEALYQLNADLEDLAHFAKLVYVSSTAAMSNDVDLDLYADGAPHFGGGNRVVVGV